MSVSKEANTLQRIPTLNQMGATTVEHDIFRKAFMSFAAEQKDSGPALDIGCAYGVVAVELAKNKVNVVACDAEARHLEILAESIADEDKPYITLVQGILPETLSFEENSFHAILASSVFHFLKPEALTESFRLIFKWLKPSRKFFVTLCSPYQKKPHSFHGNLQRAQKSKLPVAR